MGCSETFKNELQCRKLGTGCIKPQSLFACQWKWPVLVFLIYRFILPVYTSSWLIYNLAFTDGEDSMAYLTTWSYVLLTLHLWVNFLILVYKTFRLKRNGQLDSLTDIVGHQEWQEVRAMEVSVVPTTDKIPPASYRHREPTFFNTWYFGAAWILRDMVSGAAPVVTLIYFTALYPTAVADNPEFAASALDINIHGVNTALVLIDNFVSAVPTRLLHVIYPIIYGIIYVGWSLIYYYQDPVNNILYPNVLDWSKPEITIPVIFGISLILMPLLQLGWFGLYRLRLWIFHKYYKYNYCNPITM